MKIVKKLNNNVALAINNNNEEVIVVGKGIGFTKTPYELKDESILEKIYISSKNNVGFDVLNNIPSEVISYTQKIIDAGEKRLKKEFTSTIFFTLADHINFSVERFKEGIILQSPLQWEIKHLYPNEYKIGLEAVNILKKETRMEIPDIEATSIALHFINAQTGRNEMSETTKITSIIGQILNIIKYYYKMDFDEESFEFTRFVTHIRYFILRQVNGATFSNDNEDVYSIIKLKYENELICVKKIEKYLLENYNWICSNDEKLYLIMHIQRITKK